MTGCGASGNSCRAAPRSPPCSRSASGRGIMAVVLTALAVMIEIIAGYPDWLLRSIGHPVIWMGRFISTLERRWNEGSAGPGRRQILGVITVLLVVAIVAAAALVIERALLILPFGMIGVGILAIMLIAQRSLYQHVERGALCAGTLVITGRRTRAILKRQWQVPLAYRWQGPATTAAS